MNFIRLSRAAMDGDAPHGLVGLTANAKAGRSENELYSF